MPYSTESRAWYAVSNFCCPKKWLHPPFSRKLAQQQWLTLFHFSSLSSIYEEIVALLIMASKGKWKVACSNDSKKTRSFFCFLLHQGFSRVLYYTRLGLSDCRWRNPLQRIFFATLSEKNEKFSRRKTVNNYVQKHMSNVWVTYVFI